MIAQRHGCPPGSRYRWAITHLERRHGTAVRPWPFTVRVFAIVVGGRSTFGARLVAPFLVDKSDALKSFLEAINPRRLASLFVGIEQSAFCASPHHRATPIVSLPLTKYLAPHAFSVLA